MEHGQPCLDFLTPDCLKQFIFPASIAFLSVFTVCHYNEPVKLLLLATVYTGQSLVTSQRNPSSNLQINGFEPQALALNSLLPEVKVCSWKLARVCFWERYFELK